jgi:hypothetical protein
MRTFEHPNFGEYDKCPICGTNRDEEVILVAVKGTSDGYNIQAVQVHTKCLEQTLLYDKILGVIYSIADFK